MISGKSLDKNLALALRRHARGRIEGMRMDRYSFWTHWAQLAEFYLPRRYKWFIAPNQANRGAQINGQIIDETGVISARILSSGMMSGLTSPTRQWFQFGLQDLEFVEYGPVKAWLAEVERRMMRVLAESNFYTSLGTLYHDMGVFGSASMIIYDDPEQIIRCYNSCLGEFFFGASARQDIDTHGREFVLTIAQAVEMFGLENVSDSTAQQYKSGGSNLSNEIVIEHLIEPNVQMYEAGTRPLAWPVPRHFAYRETYYEQGAAEPQITYCAGFNEKPFVGARWDIVSNDSYGRSPGMDAMPAVRQLQIEQRRKAEAIDKMVRPPMVASVNMKNEPSSILPGAINYVADMQGAGFKPAFQVDPRLAEMIEDIGATQSRVREIFFVDLFMMISQLQTVRTATEIDARREEKLIQLGPVIERFENEVLDPIIDRVFGIMLRRGLIPEPPPEIAGRELNVQYLSMLSEAQRAGKTVGIERLLALGGNLAGIRPDALDVVNIDGAMLEFADALDVSPRAVNGPEEVLAIREARANAEAQERAMMATAEGVKAAELLSKTQVGGGQTALQQIMYGPGAA